QLIADQANSGQPYDWRIGGRQKADDACAPCGFGSSDQGCPGAEVGKKARNIEPEAELLTPRGNAQPHEDRQYHDKRAKKILGNADCLRNILPEDVYLVGGRELAHEEQVED